MEGESQLGHDLTLLTIVESQAYKKGNKSLNSDTPSKMQREKAIGKDKKKVRTEGFKLHGIMKDVGNILLFLHFVSAQPTHPFQKSEGDINYFPLNFVAVHLSPKTPTSMSSRS